jgi:hypothetical protein
MENNGMYKAYEKGDRQDHLGEYGEALIKDMLKKRGNVACIYSPDDGNPHYLDGIALVKKGLPFFFEVKCKPKLNHFYATGFDSGQWYHYQQMNAIFPLYIFFLDHIIGSIYYASVNTLVKNPFFNDKLPKSISFFDIGCMTELRKLTQTELNEIKKLS